MPSLRHSGALLGAIGQSVAVDNGDRPIEVREHPRCE